MTSKDFANLCRDLGVTQSMGAVGTSADNALAESFNTALKREVLQDHKLLGMTPPPAAAKCSGGWCATTRNDDTPTAAMSAPSTTKGPAHPLRCPKPHNHKSRVHYPGSRPLLTSCIRAAQALTVDSGAPAPQANSSQ